MSGISNTQGPESISLICLFIYHLFLHRHFPCVQWVVSAIRKGGPNFVNPTSHGDVVSGYPATIVWGDYFCWFLFFHNNIFDINTSPCMVKISVDRQLDTVPQPFGLVQLFEVVSNSGQGWCQLRQMSSLSMVIAHLLHKTIMQAKGFYCHIIHGHSYQHNPVMSRWSATW